MSVFFKIKKLEYRAVIQFLHLKGNIQTQIKAELETACGDSAPSFATVDRWLAQFKYIHTNATDDKSPGWIAITTTTNNIETTNEVVFKELRIKINDIDISKKRVYHILNEELNMRKLFNLDQKRVRKIILRLF